MPYDPKCPQCGKANPRPDLAQTPCACTFGMSGNTSEPTAGEKALRRAMPERGDIVTIDGKKYRVTATHETRAATPGKK